MHWKASVIVPVYNVEKYIHRCVDSILKQSYRNLELILVDDGSTDHSGRICDEYEKRDNRVRVIHQKNTGLSGARNTGIRQSTGDFLFFVDSDDYVSPHLFEKGLAAFDKSGADMI
ncbi:glycosyltransferase family 2 protein [Dialister succinatiphilus]